MKAEIHTQIIELLLLLLLFATCMCTIFEFILNNLIISEYLIHLEKRQQSILIQEIEIKVAEPLPLRTGKRLSFEN